MIRFAGVTKRYAAAAAPAVDNVSLVVARGEFRVVVGGSGSGKTTLLKLVNRLLEPDRGEILVDGRPVSEGPAHLLRRQIGYAFQGVGLFPHMSVGENIAAAPRLLGWDRPAIQKRVDELMDLVDLPRALAGRPPNALSGGQRQRVGLARALAAKPALVLLDEPFGALDALTRDRLALDFRRIHDELGLTTVMITHDMMEALLLADRIAVMRSGSILADGLAGELLSAAAHPYVRALVETPRRQAEKVAALAARWTG